MPYTPPLTPTLSVPVPAHDLLSSVSAYHSTLPQLTTLLSLPLPVALPQEILDSIFNYILLNAKADPHEDSLASFLPCVTDYALKHHQKSHLSIAENQRIRDLHDRNRRHAARDAIPVALQREANLRCRESLRKFDEILEAYGESEQVCQC